MPARILIVEDDKLSARGLALSLSDLGYDIVGVVSSGEKAVRMARESRPDLVLMDIHLAGEMDGIGAGDLIRERLDIPVVYLTGYYDGSHLERAKKTEPYGYLGKPVNLHELQNVVEIALYKHQADRRVRESERRLDYLVSTGPAVIYTCKPSGDYGATFVSANIRRILGYEPEQFLAESSFWADRIHPDDKERVFAGLTPLFDNGHQIHEYRFLHSDGTYRWMLDELILARDRDDNPIEILGNLVDITDRKTAEEQVKASLREKETLLREIHHRVRNNLAVFSSLLSLQAQYARDAAVSSRLDECRMRIESMALAHELLYQSEDLSSVAVCEYLGNLVDRILAAIRTVELDIAVIREIENVRFDLDTAIPLGFIVTELVSNCVRHAFPKGGKGRIRVSLRAIGDDRFELVVRDNGVGLPRGINLDKPRSLGLDLVRTLARHLEGEAEIRRDRGTEVRVEFTARPQSGTR